MSVDPTGFRRRRRRRAAAQVSKERACIEKHTYGRRSAHRAARILRDQGEHVHAYPCPWGAHWHVGHSAHEDLSW